MKNDITYEYRVFTNRLVDVEPMEVGICTSKVLKGLKQKDKVDGRFFHTSDTDEWYFCWNGQLQKLNLKGNSDVSAALAEAKKATEAAQKAATAADAAVSKANTAVSKADAAALSANEAVKTIDDKIKEKANISDLDKYAQIGHTHDYATEEYVNDKISQIEIPEGVDLTELEEKIANKQDAIENLDAIRSGAALGATALQSDALNGYATEKYVDDKIKQIEIPEGVDLTELEEKISKKQDKIDDLNSIISGAALGATALQSVPEEYVTETELAGKGYATTEQVNAKQDAIADLDAIISGAALGATALQSVPEEYVTETELADMGYATQAWVIDAINAAIGVLVEKADIILK